MIDNKSVCMYNSYKLALIEDSGDIKVLPKDIDVNHLSDVDKDCLNDVFGESLIVNDDTGISEDSPMINFVIYGFNNRDIKPSYNEHILSPNVEIQLVPTIHYVPFGMHMNAHFIRSYRYMDSSIWNYGIYNEAGDIFKYKIYRLERCRECLRLIYDNWVNGYYKIGNALEYADLNARIAKEARLEGGPHFEVSPFVFHSERQTLQSLREGLLESDNNYCLGHKWRMLLVDDHSSKPLNGRNENTPVSEGLTKTSVIIDRLKSNISGDCVKVKYKDENKNQWIGDDEYDIAIECVETIDGFFRNVFGDAKEKLPKRYDIILLDYRLENDYSYRIFSILRTLIGLWEKLKQGGTTFEDYFINTHYSDVAYSSDSKCLTINGNLVIPSDKFVDWISGGIGPAGRLYFMFISSYTYAIQERLEEQGIARSEKYWHIGRGACPINTPSLFLYHLHSIMKKRADTLLGDLSQVKDLFKNMFNEADLVNNCRDYFPDMLRIKSAYEILRKEIKDDTDSLDGFTSPLCRSVANMNSLTLEFWESMRHLAYMISYYSSEHWPEMWEEFHTLKSELKPDTLNDEVFKQTLEVMRSHILSLADKY